MMENPPDEVNYVAGARIAPLLLQPSEFLHRRVVQVVLPTAVRVRWRVSLDVSLPPWDGPESMPLIPLAFLNKGDPLVLLDAADGAGSALPVLTRKQNGVAAWSFLVGLALPVTANVDVATYLHRVATGDPGDAEQAVRDLRNHPDGAALFEDEFFTAFCEQLATSYLLLVEAPSEDRMVIKYSYERVAGPFVPVEDPEPDRPTLTRRLQRQIGWSATTYRFEAPSFGLADSYHFEFHVPEGVDCIGADLVTPGDEQVHTQVVTTPAIAHIYASDAEDVPEAEALVDLHAPVRGLLASSLIASALTAVVLIVAALDPRRVQHEIQGQADAAAAILLAALSLSTAGLTRRGEHIVASQLLLGVRVVTGIAAAAALAAAVLVVGQVEGTALAVGLRICAAVAVAATAVLGVAALKSAERNRRAEAARVEP